MMKLIIMPGPAFWAAVAVRTKMPVPMTAPMPSRVSWNAPRERLSDFFSAVARIASSDLIRPRPTPRGAAVAILLPLLQTLRGEPSGCSTGSKRKSAASAAQHRPKRPAAEQMDVEVRHFLSAVPADIGEQAIARRDQALFARDEPDGTDEAGNLCVGRLGREIVPRDVGTSGNDQDMDRCLRVNVVEG